MAPVKWGLNTVTCSDWGGPCRQLVSANAFVERAHYGLVIWGYPVWETEAQGGEIFGRGLVSLLQELCEHQLSAKRV